MYRGFKAHCPNGTIKEDVFKIIYAQFFPQGGSYGTVLIIHKKNISTQFSSKLTATFLDSTHTHTQKRYLIIKNFLCKVSLSIFQLITKLFPSIDNLFSMFLYFRTFFCLL